MPERPALTSAREALDRLKAAIETLYEADLRNADLRSADLWGSNLYEADLCGASHNDWTRWPAGFDKSSLEAK
jgi:uncharacterized protein YjbI with pentapeptide repeats